MTTSSERIERHDVKETQNRPQTLLNDADLTSARSTDSYRSMKPSDSLPVSFGNVVLFDGGKSGQTVKEEGSPGLTQVGDSIQQGLRVQQSPFELIDKNKDGSIDWKELCYYEESGKDGKLSETELDAYMNRTSTRFERMQSERAAPPVGPVPEGRAVPPVRRASDERSAPQVGRAPEELARGPEGEPATSRDGQLIKEATKVPESKEDEERERSSPRSEKIPGNVFLRFDGGMYDASQLRIHGTPAMKVSTTGDGESFTRFTLDRKTASDPMRTEFTTFRSSDLLDFGKEYSINFRNRLVDFKPDKSAEIIFQLHPIPANNNWAGSKSNPDVTLRTRNGMYEFTSNRHAIWRAPYKEGEWNDWQVKMKVAGDNSPGGYLDLYRNGVKVASVDGPNVRSKDNLGLPQTNQVYAKFGIYKWDWAAGNPSTESVKRAIDYDYFQMSELPNGSRKVTA